MFCRRDLALQFHLDEVLGQSKLRQRQSTVLVSVWRLGIMLWWPETALQGEPSIWGYDHVANSPLVDQWGFCSGSSASASNLAIVATAGPQTSALVETWHTSNIAMDDPPGIDYLPMGNGDFTCYVRLPKHTPLFPAHPSKKCFAVDTFRHCCLNKFHLQLPRWSCPYSCCVGCQLLLGVCG